MLQTAIVVGVPERKGHLLRFLLAVDMAARAAKTRRGFAVAVLYAERQLGVKRRWHEPRESRAGIAEAIAAEEASVHKRRVYKGPTVRVRGIVPPELGEILAGAQLQVSGQGNCFAKCLFQFQKRLAFGIDGKENVRLAAKV